MKPMTIDEISEAFERVRNGESLDAVGIMPWYVQPKSDRLLRGFRTELEARTFAATNKPVRVYELEMYNGVQPILHAISLS